MAGVIYGLADPNTHEVRYVGQTVRVPEQRLVHHSRNARNGSTLHVHNWIRSLPAPPDIVILERDPPGGLDEAERAWIAYLRSMGCRLTNLTDGGESSHSCADYREKLRVAGTGRKHTPEARAKISAAKIGVRKTPEHRAKLSEAGRARRHSEHTKAKMRASRLGRTHSAETRVKIGESHRKRAAMMKRSVIE